MQTQHKAGPVYHAGLIVCGGMCAGLELAALAATNIPAPPASDLGFLLCGLALLVGGTLALDGAAARSQRCGQPFRR